MESRMLTYHEFRFTVDDESREALTAKLLDMGALGFVEQQGALIAYFAGSLSPDGLVRDLVVFRTDLACAGLEPGFTFQYAVIAERDWNEEWKKGLAPRDIGKSLTVVPSWMRYRTDRRILIIDPGMAFGTGSHETTERCLTIVERLSGEGCGRSFLDIGTGTGILAIAASCLGCAPVVAVDTDPLAVEVARRNAELNKQENVVIKEGNIAAAEGRYDLIAANLVSDALCGIAESIAARLAPGGSAILSGMVEGQEREVHRAMERAGLSMKEKVLDGMWVTLVLSLKAGKWGSE